MDLAAQSIVNYIIKLLSLKMKTILIIAGKGNNGGDGVSCAIKLANLGYSVTLLLVYDKLSQNTQKLVENYKRLNGGIITSLPTHLSSFELIIDGVLGIGISSQLDEKTKEIFNKINDLNKFILAIDTPSGVEPFTGKIYSGAIKASVTLTFIDDKPGLHIGSTANYVGEVIVDHLVDPSVLRTYL
ncbi:MAG: YjeF protein [Burkholderiales bacterium]|jgi:hydroxyethylthiazole kinase-like uncharacterized protein yjeF|nr:YjeF protein [Burkholderiales bacterium]